MQLEELTEDDLFDDDIVSVAHGTITRRDGKAMHLTDVIKRRWGWPKKAARLAGQLLRRENKPVYLRDEERRKQQQDLFQSNPEILVAWMDGAARGSTREANDSGRLLDRTEIRFDNEIYEEGLITQVIHTLASRFGVSFGEMRGRITFQTGPLGERILHVKTKGLEE